MAVRIARIFIPLGAAAALCAGFAATAAPAATGGSRASAAGAHTGATAARHRRRRPGCGSFCRQAGGFGAGPDEPAGPVVMRAQTIRVASDGIIAVTATCHRSKSCVGAILVDGEHASYGRADLRIAANATRHVLVAVPSAGIKYLRKHRHDKTAFATVALTDQSPISISKTLTLLPPR